MAENVFEAVKQSVSTREAAEFYGIKVSRTGMACCPFHDDKNPSMKVDQRFHCFGCGADGDVIDFTAKLFNLSPKEAAEKLAQDFGLIYDSQAPPRRRYVRQKTEAQKFREDRQRCYRVLSDYYYLLKKWEADRSPRTPEEEPHPRFVEAIQKKAYVGKSTLFNSLTKAGAESANYPFCTIDPNVGVVTVPDHRLDVLGEMYNTKKITPAAIEFVDIAGLVKGASKGEGLGNQFLANIREVDAIVHVVRCFEDSNIVHVDGSIDPLRDIETINLELIFSDLEILERRIAKVVKLSRNDKTAAKELELLKRIKEHLEENKMAKSFTTDDEGKPILKVTGNLLSP